MQITFLIFGAALLPEAIANLNPTLFLYAVLSLTIIRIVRMERRRTGVLFSVADEFQKLLNKGRVKRKLLCMWIDSFRFQGNCKPQFLWIL
jgi:hypothetical protein